MFAIEEKLWERGYVVALMWWKKGEHRVLGAENKDWALEKMETAKASLGARAFVPPPTAFVHMSIQPASQFLDLTHRMAFLAALTVRQQFVSFLRFGPIEKRRATSWNIVE